ncbi:hypothetical protein [Leisingera sp.]|uniref:hypothetical protein n=1 Tax=Leisingera sp. TaxID=1879318 RepID=UPI003A5BC98E
MVAATGTDAVLAGVKLVKHSEPIVLIGIPNAKMVKLTESYAELDCAGGRRLDAADDAGRRPDQRGI